MHMKTIDLPGVGPVTIREAIPDDAERLVPYVRAVADETDNLSFRGSEFTVTVEQERVILAEYRESDNQLYLVAEASGGEILGVLSLDASQKPRLRHLGEFGLSVKKAYWNQGVGRALLTYLLDWARAGGIIRKIKLHVITSNEAAIALYRSLGFAMEGLGRNELCVDGEFHDMYAMGLLIDPQ